MEPQPFAGNGPQRLALKDTRDQKKQNEKGVAHEFLQFNEIDIECHRIKNIARNHPKIVAILLKKSPYEAGFFLD
jgi:hypothetical protein